MIIDPKVLERVTDHLMQAKAWLTKIEDDPESIETRLLVALAEIKAALENMKAH